MSATRQMTGLFVASCLTHQTNVGGILGYCITHYRHFENLILMFKARYLKVPFLLLLSLSSFTSRAEDNDDPAAFTVHIDENILNATGIQTLALQRTQYNPEIETFALRVNLSPLIATRKDYFTALAEKEKTHIILKQSQKNIRHLKNLQRENAISTRKFLAQKSQLAIDEVNFKAAIQYTNNIQQQTRSKWGAVLSHWFLTAASPYSHMFGTLDRPVYLLYLPASFATPIATVSIHPTGLRKEAQSASLISSAPASTMQQQTGTPYFYLSDQPSHDYHQRVVVWLPLKETGMSGFIIPPSAIIWHLGQAYAYLQVGDDFFKRIKINQKKLLSTGAYFIQEPLQEGDRLVIAGAQMLLSEEFRSQIPAEDDDD